MPAHATPGPGPRLDPASRGDSESPAASGRNAPVKAPATSIGQIGCGKWGKNILRDLLSLDCRVFVAETNPESRRKALDLGAEAAVDDADKLPPCDGYVVAVRIPCLARECARLLERKKPIFSEKTLCLSLEDADELAKLGGDDHIFAMHKWRYHPGIEALRIIGCSGRIGAVQEIFCVRHGWITDFHGSDALWCLGVHDLSIIQHLLGRVPEHIAHARMILDGGRSPISLTAAIGKCPTANISINTRHTDKISGVSIHGAVGSAALHNAYDDHVTVADGNGTESIAIDTTFPLYLELRHFVQYLHGGPPPLCNLESVREITRTLAGLQEKASPECSTGRTGGIYDR